MSTTLTETLTTGRRRSAGPSRPSRRRTLHRIEARGAWVLMTPYILLFLVAAAIPIGYAFYISLQKPATLVNPQSGFGGLDAFVTVVTDYRFIDTFVNIFTVMIIWLPLMILGVVGLALLIHASPGRFGGSMRFIYFVPGALAGLRSLCWSKGPPVFRRWSRATFTRVPLPVMEPRSASARMVMGSSVQLPAGYPHP